MFRTTKIQKSSNSKKSRKDSKKLSNKNKKTSAKQKASSKSKRKNANEKKKTSKSPASKSSVSVDPTNKKRKRTTSRTKKTDNKKQRTSTSKAKTKDDKSKSKAKGGSKKTQSSKSKSSKSRTGQKLRASKGDGDKKCQYQVDETFIKLLNASLDWESIEQSFFWQLLSAHGYLTKLTNPMAISNDQSTTKAKSVASSTNNRNTRANPTSIVSDAIDSNKRLVGSESSLIRLNVNNINNKLFVSFFNKINSIRHNEAVLGVTSIFKMNKPNVHMINALMKRPMNDLNLIESLFTHWLDREQEFLKETNYSSDYFNHKYNLAYLITRLILKSAIVFDKLCIRLKRQVSSSIKSSSTSNTLSKLEDEFDDIDEYDLVALPQIINKLNRFYHVRAFRNKRLLKNYKLLLALKSVFIKCFKADYDQTSDEDEFDYDYNSDNDLVNYKSGEANNEDDDDIYDEQNDSDNEGLNSDSVEFNQFTHSSSNNTGSGLVGGGSSRGNHRRIMNLKLKKYLNLKRFVDQELAKYNDKDPYSTSSSSSNSNNDSSKRSRSINFANFKLEDECESFLVKSNGAGAGDDDDDSNVKK